MLLVLFAELHVTVMIKIQQNGRQMGANTKEINIYDQQPLLWPLFGGYYQSSLTTQKTFLYFYVASQSPPN